MTEFTTNVDGITEISFRLVCHDYTFQSNLWWPAFSQTTETQPNVCILV